MKLRKAVIPVAGLGTRFLPATKTVPKELLPIVDIPSIQYVVQEAVEAGIQEIIFVTGRGKDGIEDHFDEAPELEQVLTERGQTELVEMLRRIVEMSGYTSRPGAGVAGEATAEMVAPLHTLDGFGAFGPTDGSTLGAMTTIWARAFATRCSNSVPGARCTIRSRR